jgi:hypothetical protein
MPDIIFDRYHRYIEIWPEPHKTQVEQIAELSRSCLADKQNDFNNMLEPYLNMKSLLEKRDSST